MWTVLSSDEAAYRQAWKLMTRAKLVFTAEESSRRICHTGDLDAQLVGELMAAGCVVTQDLTGSRP